MEVEVSLYAQFSEPHEWWEQYQAEMEERYAADIAGKTCLDCGGCNRCGIKGHECVGWCPEVGIWVTGEDTPARQDCGAFVS